MHRPSIFLVASLATVYFAATCSAGPASAAAVPERAAGSYNIRRVARGVSRRAAKEEEEEEEKEEEEKEEKEEEEVKEEAGDDSKASTGGGSDAAKNFKAKDAQLIVQHEFEGGQVPERMIFIGDIHGCVDEFTQLLDKVKYQAGSDQVVLVGDLVAKGPDSIGVIRKAREVNAWGVRGNHDDRVVRWREFLQGPGQGLDESGLKSLEDSGDLPYDDFDLGKPHYQIAQDMSSCDYTYLAAFPAIIPMPEPYAEWVVVHGGLEPSKALSEQNGEDVWTMRNIGPDGPNSEHEVGEAWFDVWADAMDPLAKGDESAPSTDATAKPLDEIEFYKVIYGHDAGRALQIHDITKGLDSRCVYGGELTAMILPGEELISVPCQNYDGDDAPSKEKRRRRRRRRQLPRSRRGKRRMRRNIRKPIKVRNSKRAVQVTKQNNGTLVMSKSKKRHT